MTTRQGLLDLAVDDTLDLPDLPDVLAHLRASTKTSARTILRAAADTGVPALQPRCGVGGHDEMRSLLQQLEAGAAPDLLPVTIDAHTRLRHFDVAAATLRTSPANLNGYPLVSHGWERGRELDACVQAPLEIRHGSPDARDLFAVAIASGITSFEGGGISYNLPYCKDVPLPVSLEAWREVDAACGTLAQAGVIVDRELFGTLTAVLMPPSLSLAITLLEAILAAREGVRCLSIAYPQGGALAQDVAALRAIRRLASRYLPPAVEVFPVLHQFMGVFPRARAKADALILYGGLVGRLGGAAKIITKTNQEAFGIPDVEANIAGIRTTRIATSDLFDFVRVNEEQVEQEQQWIESEVDELVQPILAASETGTDTAAAIAQAFAAGTLDIPFSASIHAHSQVTPQRDKTGAIRYLEVGALPFGQATLRRQARLLDTCPAHHDASAQAITSMLRDINYFADQGDESGDES
jgi:methylaspartate mutase epsilon subunit